MLKRKTDTNEDQGAMLIAKQIELEALILQKMEELRQKVDSMDRSNKKFLMTAMQGDERKSALEKENIDLKRGMVSFMDELDALLPVMETEGNSSLKQGFAMLRSKYLDFLAKSGIEEIPVEPGDEFDPEIHSCLEKGEAEEGKVSALIHRGFKDSASGCIIRCADVITG